jgi:3-methyladenine DNA glycosylase AlkC
MTLEFLERCARDEHIHVRRWASEGTRPRLPWGERLQDFIRDPSPTISILETLKFDSDLFVRKSVANHLNDIAKDHPVYVIQVLSRWEKEAGLEHEKKIKWIIQRSLRTLIKAGHPGALKLIGVSGKTNIRVSELKLNKRRFNLGEKIEFDFEIQSVSGKAQKLVIDYVIHFFKANRQTSPKIFKLKTFTLPAKDKIQIEKVHHLKEVTTRKHYPGPHAIEIQVNGVIVNRTEFVVSLG